MRMVIEGMSQKKNTTETQNPNKLNFTIPQLAEDKSETK